MASNDINVRFTEEKYDSKNDLCRDLGTSLVDNFWRNILLYRQQFYVKLGLHSASNTDYVLCKSEMTVAKNATLENRLVKVLNEVNGLEEHDYPKLEYNSYFNLLKYVANNNRLDDSDVRMRSILRNEMKTLDNSSLILPRYVEALNYIKNHYLDKIDIEFLHAIHKILIGSEEVSFRTKEDDAQANKVLIDRIYTCAPTNLIENLTYEVCRFIQNNDLPTITKAIIVYYTLVSIKPYAYYSREEAVLIAKAVLAQESMGEVALILPLEKLLILPKEDEAKLFNDVQKYNDTTYFVRYALDYLEASMNEFIDKFYEFKVDSVQEEYYAPDIQDEPAQKEEKLEQLNLFSVETIAPQKEEKKVAPKKEKVIEERELKEVAIRYIPRGLDEKEAAKLEVQLLEMDPSLKKKEAHFYAHHCTLGMNYTIQHYKRYCRVSYETSRTSMDHLAELGYYRKEQIKNKFIYSPIKRN